MLKNIIINTFNFTVFLIILGFATMGMIYFIVLLGG